MQIQNKFFNIIVFFIVFIGCVYADQSIEMHPVVVISGADLSQYLDVRVDQIRLYKFSRNEMQWQTIPFQIDELDNSTDYFGEKNGLLDENDEIVFLYDDAGDSASGCNQINYIETDNKDRYKIRIIYPVYPDEYKYVYLYVSDSLPLSEVSFIHNGVHSQFDFIETPVYRISHADHGLQDTLIIRSEFGGDGLNILDRQKLRVRLSLAYFGNADLNLWEGAKQTIEPLPGLTVRIRVRKKELQYTSHPIIRCHRSMRMEFRGDFTYSGSEYTHIENIMLYATFNPYDAKFRIEALNIEPQQYARVKLLRFSEDLNQTAAGMRLFNAFYEEGVRIDGQPDIFSGNLLWPGQTWYGITANPDDPLSTLSSTALFTVISNQTTAMGEEQNFYYQDTVQPVPYDTGDNQSFGDTGILITGCTVAGSLISEWHQYFFASTFDEPSAHNLLFEHNHPPLVHTKLESLSSYTIPSVQLPDTSFCEDDTLQIPFQVFNEWLTHESNWPCKISVQLEGSDNLGILTDSIQSCYSIFSKVAHWFGRDSLSVTITNAMDTLAKTRMSILIAPVPDPPQPFMLLSPPDQSTVQADTIEFTWQDAVDPDPGDTVFYTLKLDTSIFFNSSWLIIKKNISSVSYIVGNIPMDTLCTWYWRVTAKSQDSLETTCENDFSFVYGTSSVSDENYMKPEQLVLFPNYPNPFNSRTQFKLKVYRSVKIKLQILNCRGQFIFTLTEKPFTEGDYSFDWDGTDCYSKPVSSGIYILHLQSDHEIINRKMVLLR